MSVFHTVVSGRPSVVFVHRTALQVFPDGEVAPQTFSFFDMPTVPRPAARALRARGGRRCTLEGDDAADVVAAVRAAMRELWAAIRVGDLDLELDLDLQQERGGERRRPGPDWRCVVCLDGADGGAWLARTRCCGVVFHGACLQRVLSAGMACPTCRSEACPFCDDDQCTSAF